MFTAAVFLFSKCFSPTNKVLMQLSKLIFTCFESKLNKKEEKKYKYQ